MAEAVYVHSIRPTIAFDLIAGFEWDEGNSAKSVGEHEVGRAEAEQVFLNEPPLVVHDVRHGASEPRFHAFGTTDAGRLLHVSFTLRQGGTRLRVISARDMHRKERALYGEQV